MAISEKSTKILWAGAAGRCSFQDCNIRLIQPEAAGQLACTLGEMAHIHGENLGSNRHNPNLSAKERDDYTNLILLCPTHHTLIDKRENEDAFPPALLHSMKEQHETLMLQRTETNAPASKHQVASQIVPLTRENKEVFFAFGPRSERARKDPHNESAFAMWLTERLSVIVPNNRRIVAILGPCDALFSADELTIINRLRRHVRSYEQWVNDEIEYDLVTRFPLEFEELIEGLSHAGTQ